MPEALCELRLGKIIILIIMKITPQGCYALMTCQLAGSYLSVFIIPTGDQWSQLVREATFSSQYVQKILDIGLDGGMGNMSASMTRLALTKSNDTVIGTIH